MFSDLDHIFASVADGIVILDTDLRYVFLNDAAAAMLGVSREAAEARTPSELFASAALADALPRAREALVSGQRVHYQAYDQLTNSWFENRIHPSAGGVTIFFTDITSRRRAEEALRRSEEGHRLLVSLNDAARSSRDAEEVMWAVVTRAGRHFQVSRCTYGEIDAAQEHVSVIRDYVDGVRSIAGRHRIEEFGPELIEDLKKGRTAIIADVATDPRTAACAGAFAGIQTRSLICVPLVKGEKFVSLFVLHHKDPRDWSEHDARLAEQIAERIWSLVEGVRAEASLRESRDVLSLAMRGGRMGAWSRDMLTNEVWWSRELEELFGLPPGAFQGSQPGFRAYLHRDDTDRIDRIVEQAVASGTDYVMEFRFRHSDGTYRWMEGRGRGIYGPDGSARWLYGIGIDITERKLAEEAIAAAREAADADAERLNLALEAARLGDWSWDVRSDLVTLSPRAAEIFGIASAPRLTWQDLRGLLHPEDREPTQRAVQRALETRGPYLTEYRLIQDGRERWVVASGRARYDADGVAGMFGVIQDITGDRLLVRLDDAVRSMVDPEEITQTAARLLGGHLDVNRCAYATVDPDEDTFDLSGNYTKGTHSIVGRYRFRQFGAECLRLMRAGEPYLVSDSKDDPRIGAEDRIAYEQTAIRAVICVPVMKSGRFVAAMAVHALEPREWTSSEVQLLQRVASRCWESLERAHVQRERASLLEAAEAANRAKDEFLAMLGHELRNPLSPILTALQLMKLRGDDSSLRERVVIERQVTHLTRLVDDLLDVSRIARGKVELKTAIIELPEVVARAIEVASPLLEQRTQTLDVEAPAGGLLVEGDPARLTQVVSNLLTNACKYTAPGGHIRVLVGEEDGGAVIRVRDNGVGIAADILPHVFDLFVQGGQAIDRAEGGLGLGLTIVRSLTERHGGIVSAHSDGPGRGSEFVVRLPLAPMPAKSSVVAANSELREGVPSGGLKILVVDDNVDAAEMLAHALDMNGHDTWVAHDGPEALRQAAAARPAAAFLDIGLPVMDGYELASRLRQVPGLEAIRLIAVTGYGQESDRRRSGASGFDHHLTKPVNLDDIHAVLDGLLRETGP